MALLLSGLGPLVMMAGLPHHAGNNKDGTRGTAAQNLPAKGAM